jgi:hypothetical protein
MLVIVILFITKPLFGFILVEVAYYCIYFYNNLFNQLSAIIIYYIRELMD